MHGFSQYQYFIDLVACLLNSEIRNGCKSHSVRETDYPCDYVSQSCH